MKQTLQLKLSQHFALTPQLQQAIRLLQLSTLDLNQEIEQCLQTNPLLELDEPANDMAGSYLHDAGLSGSDSSSREEPASREVDEEAATYDAADPASTLSQDWTLEGAGGKPRDAEDDDGDPADFQSAQISLREHLGAQLGLMQLEAHDRHMVNLLIEALDEDGYLEQSLDDLADMLMNELSTEKSSEDGDALDREAVLGELNIALRRLQSLDPPGIGARSPQECLSLQLRGISASAARDLAMPLVEKHLDLLAARDFSRLKRVLRCSDDELRAAHALICTLNPRPGAQYARLETRYIVPDVVVRKLREGWVASLNQEAVPRLRINRLYADILQGKRGGGGASGLSGQLQEARWLIKNIKQRFDTIQRVSQAIVDRQQSFFEHGEVAMRPLTLREIADTLELHESTISRVTTQKFMATPRGIFELKYFFGSHVATDTGGAASSTAIRALIKKLISAEDGHKPLSDAKIAEILGEQGLVVARRTVAKYREGLGIPPANLRKSL